MEQQPEPDRGSISQFLGDPFLTDIEVTFPNSKEHPHKMHKFVLAAASGAFREMFKKKDPAIVTKFTVPPLPPLSQPMIEDPYEHLIKYMYNNQDYASIKDKMQARTIFPVLIAANELKLAKLVADTSRHIAETILDDDSCVQYYIDLAKWAPEDTKFLMEKCLQVM